jgi:hypothetical protein
MLNFNKDIIFSDPVFKSSIVNSRNEFRLSQGYNHHNQTKPVSTTFVSVK